MRAGRGKQGRGDRPAVRGLVSWVESGELAVEVSLNGGGDEGGRLFGWDGRDCADLPDVAHHGQTDNLAGGERRSDESLVVVESGWDGVEDVDGEIGGALQGDRFVRSGEDRGH